MYWILWIDCYAKHGVNCFNQTHVHLWIKETNGFNFTNEIWCKYNYNVSLFLWTTLHVLFQWMKWNKCLQLNNFVVVAIQSWMKTLVFLLFFQFYLSFFFNFSLVQITFLQQTPFFCVCFKKHLFWRVKSTLVLCFL